MGEVIQLKPKSEPLKIEEPQSPLASLEQNMKQLDALHLRLKDMLSELEELVK